MPTIRDVATVAGVSNTVFCSLRNHSGGLTAVAAVPETARQQRHHPSILAPELANQLVIAEIREQPITMPIAQVRGEAPAPAEALLKPQLLLRSTTGLSRHA